jgi:hypothetical protein
MNPIEHVWDYLEQALKRHQQAFRNLEELEAVLSHEWENLSQDCASDFLRSTPRRMEAIIRARGGNTGYIY